MHAVSGRWPTLLLAAVVLLAGCTTSPNPAYQNYLDLSEVGFRLPIPDGWGAAKAGMAQIGGLDLVAYLSNQELQVDCVAPADQSTCFGPVPYLEDGALLASWTTKHCAGTACQLPDGERLLIGGREATRQRGTSVCSRIGATDEVAYLVQVTPQRIDTIFSCERNVTAEVRTVFIEALGAVDWRTP